MSYFIFDGVLECGRQYELKGEEAGHILKSRRLRVGDYFLIQDEQGRRFEVVLQNLSRNSLKFVPEKNGCGSASVTSSVRNFAGFAQRKSIGFYSAKND